MASRRRIVAVALLAVLLPAAAQQAAPLRVCVPEDSAPYSSVEQGQGRGLDLDLLRAAALRLGRPLEAVWFESRYDKDGNLSLDARALLAADACDLVAGIPLYEPQLAPMIAEKARTPDYPGAKPLRQRPWQTLVPVAGGAPYRATALVLVARNADDAAVGRFDALEGRAVAVRAGSMASLALVGWHGGKLASSIRGYNVHEDVIGAVAGGRADFALVDVAVWDRFRRREPDSPLRLTAFDHPLKMNIGLLARASDAALLNDVESALAAVRAGGGATVAAAANGATWVAPVTPVVRPALSLRDFAGSGG